MALSKGVKVALWVGGGVLTAGAVYLIFFHKKTLATPKAPTGVAGVLNSVATGLSHVIPALPGIVSDAKSTGNSLAQLFGLGTPAAQAASTLVKTGSDTTTPTSSVPAQDYADAGVNSDGIPNALAAPSPDTTVDTAVPVDPIASIDTGVDTGTLDFTSL